MKGVMKGIAAGMAIGATMGVVGGIMMKKKKSGSGIKKSAGKALHAAGSFVENMSKW